MSISVLCDYIPDCEDKQDEACGWYLINNLDHEK